MYRYGDKVKVTSGFYENKIGFIVKDKVDGYYKVAVGLYIKNKFIDEHKARIHESNLESIK